MLRFAVPRIGWRNTSASYVTCRSGLEKEPRVFIVSTRVRNGTCRCVGYYDFSDRKSCIKIDILSGKNPTKIHGNLSEVNDDFTVDPSTASRWSNPRMRKSGTLCPSRWRNFSHYCRPQRQYDVLWAQRSTDHRADKRLECKGEVHSSPQRKKGGFVTSQQWMGDRSISPQ